MYLIKKTDKENGETSFLRLVKIWGVRNIMYTKTPEKAFKHDNLEMLSVIRGDLVLNDIQKRENHYEYAVMEV